MNNLIHYIGTGLVHLLLLHHSVLHAQLTEWTEDDPFINSSEKVLEQQFSLQKDEGLQFESKEKLDINAIVPEDLERFEFLNPNEIEQIIAFLHKLKPLISTLELQTLMGIAPEKIRKLINLTYVLNDRGIAASETQMNQSQKQFLLLRWNRRLETPSDENISDSSASRKIGSPDKLLLKFRGFAHHKLQYGLTLEKDAGESWLMKSGLKLPDYISANASLRNLHKKIPHIILGDYSLSLGLGLLLDNGSFKSGLPELRISFKTQYGMKAYSSIGENEMLRGICARMTLALNFDLIAYTSYKLMDSRLDSSDNKPTLLSTRFQESGLHTTNYELSNRKNQSVLTSGVVALHKTENAEIGLHGMYNANQYDQSNTTQLEKIFIPEAQKLCYGSGFYKMQMRNIFLTGELVMDTRKNTSYHQSLAAGIGKRAEIACEFYRYGPGFYAHLSQANTSSGKSWNQTGYMLQFNFNIKGNLKLSLAYEINERLWDVSSGYYSKSPTSYSRLSLSSQQRRKWQSKCQIELRSQALTENPQQVLLPSIQRTIHQLSIQIYYEMALSRSLKWRNRIQWKCLNSIGQNASGFFCAQDILYKPLAGKLNFNARIAYFDLGKSGLKMYVFENDVMYHYGFQSHSGSGLRYYFNIRWKPFQRFNIEAKLSQTLVFIDVQRSSTPFEMQNQTSNATLQWTYEF
ncbi:MAG: hypothetical protein IPM92_05155 [Saprospiraceae bacterium]|nr:hypothetical protein [Saprospiraceae bacterium]